MPRWLALQARIAPVDRLLAAREAAENDEVDDCTALNRRSEDRPAIADIRKDERSHSLAVQEMRSRGDGTDGRPDRDPPIAVPGARAHLDRILGREKWHRTSGGWISGAIYGANDGLAAVFGIVAGVSGATGGSSSS